MPVIVPTQAEFDALKAKVEALEIPQNVKDALIIILNWMIAELIT